MGVEWDVVSAVASSLLHSLKFDTKMVCRLFISDLPIQLYGRDKRRKTTPYVLYRNAW